MRLSVARSDFLYVTRPDAVPGVAHAVEHAENPRGFADVTLCGASWDGEWNDLRPEDVRPVGSGNGGLCGVCDKAIRTRIREAREAQVIAHLRSQGEDRALKLLQELVLELSEVYGALIDCRRAMDRAVETLHSGRCRMLAIVFAEEGDDGGVPRKAEKAPHGMEGTTAGAAEPSE